MQYDYYLCNCANVLGIQAMAKAAPGFMVAFRLEYSGFFVHKDPCLISMR